MKKTALLFLLPGLVAIKTASAQTAGHLKLSSQYPTAGEKVSFTYDPTGTPLEGKTKPEGMIYFLDNKEYPAADIDLKADGKLFSGSFTVPVNAKFFFIKLNQDTSIDNNSKQGYTYFVYKNQAPVEGAYAQKAYMLYSGMGTALDKIPRDVPEATRLYKKEFEMYPESKKDYQLAYVNVLMLSTNPADKTFAEQQVMQMAQSGDEKNMTAAVSLLKRLKKTTQADSLSGAIKAQFPNSAVKTEMQLAFNKEKDPVKKEELYKQYIAKYPEDVTEKRSIQDNYRLQVAAAYLEAGKFDDYDRVAATVKNQSNLTTVLNNEAYALAKKGDDLDRAAKLSKQSLDMVNASIKNPDPIPYQSPKSMVKIVYQSNLRTFGDTYAYILLKQDKFKEAYTYEQPIYDNSKGRSAEINETYALILNGMGKNKESMQVIEDAIKSGRSTTPMIGALKEAYVKVKGSDNGFEAYYSPMRESFIQKLKGDLLKEMINKPAPAFALKDFNGNTVSLADLKGKVVIVDFWATWCGPCKASFPGMQMAVTKFKDDPNVKFLFIDTWETVENYQAEAKKFIADNKYTFNVLEDEKNSDGKHGKIVADFGVEGIPTKFILDGNGNIRFKHIGFDGSTEGLVDEVSTMIDIAAHPTSVAVQTNEKTSGPKD